MTSSEINHLAEKLAPLVSIQLFELLRSDMTLRRHKPGKSPSGRRKPSVALGAELAVVDLLFDPDTGACLLDGDRITAVEVVSALSALKNPAITSKVHAGRVLNSLACRCPDNFSRHVVKGQSHYKVKGTLFSSALLPKHGD
jgi:hypothetical protein